MEGLIANAVVALVAIGMGIAFFVADPRAPTSRALALFLVAMGIAIAGVELLELAFGRPGPLWVEIADVVFETLAFLAAFEWGLRVSRTVPGAAARRQTGERAVRLAQALVLVYAALAVAYPELRAEGFGPGAGGADLGRASFYLFAVPLLAAGLLIVFAAALLAGGPQPDRAESVRVIGLICAGPFLIAALMLPNAWVPISVAIGEVIFLISAIRYHVMQGERGQFVARFMSPQVAELVRSRGIRNAMQTDRLQISVVACDIRGFTAYARQASPEHVMQVLREYYRAVGELVAQFGATIKDQAGDGILILVGAPIPHADHAPRAIDLAQAIRARVRPALGQWSSAGMTLGLGIGIGTGDVAVGVIGEASRLEYTAVGSAVNLASRLCEQAADGQIRIDGRTRELLAGTAPAEPLAPLALKGFDQPVPSFLL
jgi:adenylate cyclase